MTLALWNTPTGRHIRSEGPASDPLSCSALGLEERRSQSGEAHRTSGRAKRKLLQAIRGVGISLGVTSAALLQGAKNNGISH